MEALFSESQLAQKLGVSKRTVERLRKSKQIRFLRIAARGRGVVRFSDAHVAEYLARQELSQVVA